MLVICILGQPNITSTVLPLSGGLCPGRVTFSCNSLESDSPVIGIFRNNTRLVRYDFSPQHTYPYIIPSSPAGFMAQITSVIFNNAKFSYVNFTVSVDLMDLIIYQGQSISCGNILVRSNLIEIDNYTIQGEKTSTIVS